MITEIRRHYTTLCNRMEELGIRMGWSHASANNKYMLLAKDLAIRAIEKPSGARSSDRNNIDGPNFTHSQDDLLPDMNMENNNNDEQRYANCDNVNQNTPVLSIPNDQLHFFINLLQTKNNVRHRWINGCLQEMLQ